MSFSELQIQALLGIVDVAFKPGNDGRVTSRPGSPQESAAIVGLDNDGLIQIVSRLLDGSFNLMVTAKGLQAAEAIRAQMAEPLKNPIGFAGPQTG